MYLSYYDIKCGEIEANMDKECVILEIYMENQKHLAMGINNRELGL